MLQTILVVFLLPIIGKVNCGCPLDTYVYDYDKTLSWKLIQTYPYTDYTVYIINMTSQTWQNSSFSSRPVWWHYMIVTVPQVFKHPDVGFLMISGGSNNDPVPTGSRTTDYAVQSGTVAVEIQQIPNQPIQFNDDPTHMERYEDDIVAWLWRVYIETKGQNPYILPFLPMTKAVFYATEVTMVFLKERKIQPPLGYIVSGISKRGWTAWLFCAIGGTRVLGAAPIVLDMVNLQPHWKNHYRSLAGWSFVLKSFHDQNIMKYLDDVYFQLLSVVIDPYTYFYRFNHLKILQFQAADDQYFPADSEDFFWNDLQVRTGGSYLRRIPNVHHYNITGFQESLGSFYLSICNNATLPLWTWKRTINETHGEIIANVSIVDGHPIPINVTVLQARTIEGTKRDFRMYKFDPITNKSIENPVVWLEMNGIEISQSDPSTITYKYVTPMPPAGFWDGLFMQVTFPGPENTTLTLTTETLILPDTYPVEPCTGQECYGTLV